MAAEERVAASVRGTLFRGHHWYGRRAGAVGGVHRRVPDRQHGQRLGQAGQLVGRASPAPVIVLDARAAVVVDVTFVHRARLAGRQAHD